MIKGIVGAFLALLLGTLMLAGMTVSTSNTVCESNRQAQTSGPLPVLKPLTNDQWDAARTVVDAAPDSNLVLTAIAVTIAIHQSDLHQTAQIDGKNVAIDPLTGAEPHARLTLEMQSILTAVGTVRQQSDLTPTESAAWAVGKPGLDLTDEYGQAALIVGAITKTNAHTILDGAVTDPYCTYVQQPMGDVLTINGVSYPVPGYTAISSRYGYRIHPITHERTLHSGIDFPAPCGTPIVPIRPGIVVYVNEREPGFGTLIEIEHADHTQTWYGHMYPGSIYVREGDRVSEGQHIADVGSAGTSTGCHLHVELHLPSGKAVDPGPVFGWY